MQAKKGDKVKVHYTLKDANGQIVESSRDVMPIEFIIGEGMVIAGFEKGVTGMQPNETKTITVAPEDGYGKRDERKIFEYSRKNTPAHFDPRIGQTVKLHRADGKAIPVTVLESREDSFLMDANHPLAGKELTFELELIEIVNE